MRKKSPKKSIKIVVCPETGMRLCQDNKWRRFANFGSYSSCVREFKYLKSALKAGIKHRLRPAADGYADAQVIHLYAGDSMDASGVVVRGSRVPRT